MKIVVGMLLFLAAIVSTTGFSSTIPYRMPVRRISLHSPRVFTGLFRGESSRTIPFLASSPNTSPSGSWLDDYSDDEIQDMRSLILSLSLEPNDSSRRARLNDIFSDAYQRSDGVSPQRFGALFDRMVIKIGDEKQNEAKQRYFEAQAGSQQQDEDSEPLSNEQNNAGSGKDGGQKVEREKSPDELQLWALVDMMVQVKTIIKRGISSPGSAGDFQ